MGKEAKRISTRRKEREKMTTTLQKWGNSLAVRLPKDVIEQAGIDQGTELVINVEQGRIQLIPKREEPTLEELLNRITPENRHEWINFGREGNELL
ncbi:MAG: AbrB/MazE/SpoVT family DNA-binding domain-containing protein [Sporolactobacillus sp.]